MEFGFKIQFLHGLCHIFRHAEGWMEAICFERRDLRCRSFDALIVFSHFARLPPKNPIPDVALLSVNMEHPLSVSFAVDSLPGTPENPDDTFATKRLTINTNNCTTTYYRHSVAMKTDASLSMYTVMEASAIELSPSARLFADFSKTPVTLSTPAVTCL